MSIKKWDGGKFLIDLRNKISAGSINGQTYQAIEKLFVFCLENADDMGVLVENNIVSINPIFPKLNSSQSLFHLESNGTLRFAAGLPQELGGQVDWTANVDNIILALSRCQH